MTIKQALNFGQNKLSSALDAEVLLCFTLDKSREYLFANLDKKINVKKIRYFNRLLNRRKKHEPIAYIIKNKEFFGLDFFVDKRVLIPRPETEILVETVLNHELRIMNYELRIADVGTGSGCIAVALAKNLKRTKIWAIDISKQALQVARKNIEKHKVGKRVELLHGDLLKPLGKNKVDIIVANLPYLTVEQLRLTENDVRFYEPKIALACKKEETELYGRLLKMAPKYLKKNGIIFLEIDPEFSVKLVKLVKLVMPGMKIKIKKDLAGKDRILSIQF